MLDCEVVVEAIDVVMSDTVILVAVEDGKEITGAVLSDVLAVTDVVVHEAAVEGRQKRLFRILPAQMREGPFRHGPVDPDRRIVPPHPRLMTGRIGVRAFVDDLAILLQCQEPV